MNSDKQFSEEQLNALLDDELDPEEQSRIYRETERRPDLDQRLCQQRKVKALVKLAYQDVPGPKRGGGSTIGRGRQFGRAVAAAALLAVAISAGFLLGRAATGPMAENSAIAEEPDRYLIHVASEAPEHMAAALERAEYLLESAGEDGIRQVEIVANQRGVNMLRSDVTQFADQISTLQKNNVVFYACSRSIQRLQEEGEVVRLVPHVIAEYTALDRVVTRMQEGWTYEKI
jgi:intracellular sulfur oxidation DsrE/DsrF family protein